MPFVHVSKCVKEPEDVEFEFSFEEHIENSVNVLANADITSPHSGLFSIALNEY